MNVRRRQLLKARDRVARHEVEKLAMATMPEIIEALIREGAICAGENSCVVRKATADGDVRIDVTVAVPVKKVYMEVITE